MPRALKACGTCGQPAITTPCADCERSRPRDPGTRTHKLSRTERGLGSRWVRLRDRAVRRQPWCAWPGGCDYRIDETNPLTGDHIVPRSAAPERMYDPTNIVVLCRRHNSEKGTRTA